MNGTVLVSTHRLPLAGRLREAFAAAEYAVEFLSDADQVTRQEDRVLLVVTGAKDEQDLAAWMTEARHGFAIPVLTLLPGPGGARLGVRAGAEEALKGETDLEEVALLGHRAVQRRRLQVGTGIVGEAEPIRELLDRIGQIAPADSTVLITGESGTGKELVARGVHTLSPRRHRAFLAVNVAALSETLLESELFGHEKGSFTGAIDARKGFFELAHRGTLFLDEIGEMPLSTQTKLLRALEQREFLRVGGEKAIQVDVRIIAATNQELRGLVATGRFRRDLYYRLNILGIELPPLRDRREDVPRLVHHFVRELSARMDRPFPGISEEAMELLVRYDWPGNVRELRNLIESMVVLSPGREIGPADIPKEIRDPAQSQRLLPVPFSPARGAIEPEGGVDSLGRPRLRPELEFVFRTLVELRMDVDQLRREFDFHRDDIEERLVVPRAGRIPLPGEIEDRSAVPESPPEGRELAGAEDRVVFRSGMTIEAMEAEAIRLVLQEVGGNRRRAAEALGIGERTLYRKIQRYGIEG